jgi:pantoate--beta-alanine ligase
MRVLKTIKELREYRKKIMGKVGFVATMGYLHKGHASLINAARKECSNVIVSIFVNPKQFGRNEDLDKYPRDIKRDIKLCKEAKVDCIFYPENKEMYPGDESTIVDVEKVTEALCGKFRPTHFRGVTTVVIKLFNIITPDIAYFGQKDLQQSVVIKKMTKDLNLNVEIRVCSIIREKDGLAMSSRNKYLNIEERAKAVTLYKSLTKARNAFKEGIRNVKELKTIIKKEVDKIIKKGIDQIQYIDIIDINSLKSVKKAKKGDAIAIAVFIGKTRLIDNIIL